MTTESKPKESVVELLAQIAERMGGAEFRSGGLGVAIANYCSAELEDLAVLHIFAAALGELDFYAHAEQVRDWIDAYSPK
jgi:hypothetical protein